MIKTLVLALVVSLAPALVPTAPATLAAAAVSSDVTPLLTGGVVHWAGHAERDEKATDTAAATLTNSTDYGEADSPIAWDTHTLVDFHYPDAPTSDFQAGWPISAYDETDTTGIGANGTQQYTEHFVDCDDSPDGVTCDHTVTKDFACNWTEVGGTNVWPRPARPDPCRVGRLPEPVLLRHDRVGSAIAGQPVDGEHAAAPLRTEAARQAV